MVDSIKGCKEVEKTNTIGSFLLAYNGRRLLIKSTGKGEF